MSNPLARTFATLATLVVATAAVAALPGCTYDTDTAKTRPTTRTSDAALKDPYGKWGTVDTDITGGGVTNLNRDALRKDVDSFLLK